MRLLLILSASFLSRIFLDSEITADKLYKYSYSVYVVFISMCYTIAAIASWILLPKTKSIQLVLSLMLICCMTISSLFNLLFLNQSLYPVLSYIKHDAIFCMNNTYLAVELAALPIVGKDGFDFIRDNSRFIRNRLRCFLCRNVNYY